MELSHCFTTPPNSATKKPLVLIVEDEPDVRQVYAMLFERDKVGFEWQFAFTVDGAIAAVDQAAAKGCMFPVVVTDLMLGDVSRTGLNVVKHIRDHGYPCRIATMSGYDELPLTLPQKLMEIDRTLDKPMEIFNLSRHIEEMLKAHESDAAQHIEIHP